jgi:hypothetical protein
MKLGIMQPYFFPYIGYFQLINAVDKYVIYDDVNWINRGWINRNRLLLNGKDFMFNIIVLGASQNKLINEITVEANQSKLLKTIETAYKKAPFYVTVFPLIKSIIDFENKNLARYLGDSLIQIANYLDMTTEFIYSSDIKGKKSSLKGQDKILDICKVLGATEYSNAIGGQELYDKVEFEQNGIKLSFLKTHPIEYKQFKNEFVPNLSILDVLMFNSVEEIKGMMRMYELV